MNSRYPPGLGSPYPPAAPSSVNFSRRASAMTTGQTGGTVVERNGVVKINLLTDDLEIPFLAVRDTVRFLAALYPDWSTPVFAGGNAHPNEVGSSYRIETYEKKIAGEFDGAEKEISIRKQKLIKITEIISEQKFKVITYQVTSKMDNEIFAESFPPTTYILVEIRQFPYEDGKYEFVVTFDGGPPEVDTKYCCFCISLPGSLQMQEEAQIMRPKINNQSRSLVDYIRRFDPNSPLSQLVAGDRVRNEIVRKNSSNTDIRSFQTGTFESRKNSSQLGYRGSFNQTSPGSAFPGSKSGAKTFKSNYQNNYVSPVMQLPPDQAGYRNNGSLLSGPGGSRRDFQGFPPRRASKNSSNLGSNPGSGGTSDADEIRKLFDLYKDGALSKADFEDAKSKIINGF